MRIIYLILLISLVCLVSAKYLPDESTSRALLRNKRSYNDDMDDTIENQSNESDDDSNDDDDGSSEQKRQQEIEKLQKKHAEEQRKLQEKREKEERKREEHLRKEQRKREEFEAKIKEEERKEQRKREEFEAKIKEEERKIQEKLEKEERKQKEKQAKEERKRLEKQRKQLEKIEKKTMESKNTAVDSSESGEDLDFEDIWKNYIYEKYGLATNSTDLEKDAAVYSYIKEELGLTANSTKNEYREAVLQLVNIKLLEDNSTSVNGFQNYFASHVNAIQLQKLQADIENKIAELDNDTALLQNVSLPWAPEAKHAIGQEKSILSSIAQFLSDVVPTWITGGKPVSNTSISSLPISDNSPNAGLVPTNNEGSISTSDSNFVVPVNGPLVTTESVGSSNPSAEGLPTADISSASVDITTNILSSNTPSDNNPTGAIASNADGALNVVNTVNSLTDSNLNIDAPSNPSIVDLNEGSVVSGDSHVSVVASSASGLSPSVSEESNINNILTNNSPAGNSPSDPVVSNADSTTSVVNIVGSNTDLSVNANPDSPISSSTVDLNEQSSISQSVGSAINSNGFVVPSSTSGSSPVVSEQSNINNILPNNSPAGNSPSDPAVSNADSTTSVVNIVNTDLSVNSNPDSSISSSTVDLNEQSSIGQSVGSAVDSNGSAVTSSTSGSSPVVSEGSITNDILATNTSAGNTPTDLPASNVDGASSVVNIVTSNADSSLNSNPVSSIGSSTVNLNEHNSIGQSVGSAVENNGSAVKPDIVSNVGETSSVLPSDTSLIGLADSQFSGSSVSISASPSAESSTSTDILSTGTEAPSSSVASSADANAQVSNVNGSIVNSGIQIVVENAISESPDASVNIATSSSVSAGVEGTSSIDMASTVAPSLIVESSSASSLNQSEGSGVSETISGNPNLSVTPIVEITTSGGQVLPVSSSTGSSVNVVSDASLLSNASATLTQDTGFVGFEPNVENTGNPADINNTLNIVPSPISSDVPTIAAEPTAATSTSDVISIAGSSSVQISSAVDNTGLPSETPVVTVQNNVDKPVDSTLNNQVIIAESTDPISITSPSSSDTTSSVSNEPISLEPSANTDIIVASSTTDIASSTLAVTAVPDVSISINQEVEVPVAVAVTNTSETQPLNDTISVTETATPVVISNETLVNDATVNTDVSVSPPEDVTNIALPTATQTSLLENEVPVAVTVASEPSGNWITAAPGQPIIVNIVPINDITNASPTTVSPIETSTPVESKPFSVPPVVSSDSVGSSTAPSVNDIPASNSEVTLAPGSAIVGTDSTLLSTSDVIATTQPPQATQNTNTPIAPEEIGASLLEVTAQ